MGNSGRITSVTKALRILELLEQEEGLTVTALADELGVSKSSAHRYLHTLLEAEYIVEEDSVYRVGLRCLSHGIRARARQEGFDQIDSKVEELASQTGERVNYMVHEHGKAVCLSQSLGERGVQFELSVGDRIPLHIISPGKAILASWEDADIEQYLTEHGLSEATENTIVDEKSLWKDIERIRNRGFSQSKQEYMGELNGVAVPVYGTNESIIGAIGVSGPTHRMQGERFNKRLPELLMGTAREIALNLQYSN